MINNQTIGFVFQIFSLLGVFVGLIYTGFQIQLLRTQYRDFHDWNRRKAAQDSLEAFVGLAEGNKNLNEAFSFLTSKDPIPYETLNKKFEDLPELRTALHRLLNFLESLAIGVRHGVLDEEIVCDAFREIFPLVRTQFNEYITARRRNHQPESWMEIDLIIAKWERKKNVFPERIKTGRK